MKPMRTPILVALLVACGACSRNRSDRALDATPALMTVCQLFSDLPSHQDQIVAVRGVYYFGLVQNGCSDQLLVKDHAWPTAVDIALSDLPSSFGDRPVGFRTDLVEWHAFENFVIQEGLRRRREEVWVTVVGQLRGPVWHLRNGEKGTGGYGHLGAYAAQLVVKRVENIEVKPNPSYDYFQLVPHALGGPPSHL
jgi:hypothetical protein